MSVVFLWGIITSTIHTAEKHLDFYASDHIAIFWEKLPCLLLWV